MSTKTKARKLHVIERHDEFSHLRGKLREIAQERNDYAGCPMPLDGQRLVIEPTYRYRLDEIGKPEAEPEDPVKIRNFWFSTRLRAHVAICEHPEGKFWWSCLVGSGHGATALLNTLGASDAWGIEQEATALNTLGKMLRHRQFKQYLLTGTFIERSVRSGVFYIFRKLRPTLALATGSAAGPGCRPLCTLCMHPIGYYEESWAGCMCPTDDVIAHLALMRGDEHMFWRRCHQHNVLEPAGGLA